MVSDLTVIVPVYNEENNIQKFYKCICDVFKANNLIKNKWNVLFVDDGSSDGTLNHVVSLGQKNDNVKYISFSRNFGKESAIYAGIDFAHNKMKSSHCVLMDVDLQDPPELIPKMIKIMNNKNCDCVCSRKSDRKGDPKIRSFFSNLFYSVINKVSKIDIKSGTRDFRLMNKNYVEAILACQEYNRFFKGIASWIGFKVEWVEFPNVVREDGKSKLSIMWLFKYSVEAIVAYTTWPLTIISVIGLVLAFVSLVFLVYIFIKAICFGDPVAGWPSLACLILFLGSLLLTALGVLGLYFEKMYLEVKNRPKYLISKHNF